MLLRVLRPLSGSVDGVDLTRFEEGRVYKFTSTVASFLLAIGAAQPADDGAEAALWPAEKRMFDSRRQSSATQERWTGPERRRDKR